MAGGETRVRDAVPTVSLTGNCQPPCSLASLCVRACAHARARARNAHALWVRAGHLHRGRVGGGAAAVVLVWVTDAFIFVHLGISGMLAWVVWMALGACGGARNCACMLPAESAFTER